MFSVDCSRCCSGCNNNNDNSYSNNYHCPAFEPATCAVVLSLLESLVYSTAPHVLRLPQQQQSFSLRLRRLSCPRARVWLRRRVAAAVSDELTVDAALNEVMDGVQDVRTAAALVLLFAVALSFVVATLYLSAAARPIVRSLLSPPSSPTSQRRVVVVLLAVGHRRGSRTLLRSRDKSSAWWWSWWWSRHVHD